MGPRKIPARQIYQHVLNTTKSVYYTLTSLEPLFATVFPAYLFIWIELWEVAFCHINLENAMLYIIFEKKTDTIKTQRSYSKEILENLFNLNMIPDIIKG